MDRTKHIGEFQAGWIGGVNTALTNAALIRDDQAQWARNATTRGGQASPRPGFRFLSLLPGGLMQGAGFFSVAGGRLALMVNGRLWDVRVRGAEVTYQKVPLDWENSAREPMAWFCETAGSMVIQDGQSSPILWDGGAARRADRSKLEVPLGKQMAYGNGRLWVASGRKLWAGDITQPEFGSELVFSEATYLFGGGSFWMPGPVTALSFIPRIDTTTGFGSLLVFGDSWTSAMRAEIISRDAWSSAGLDFQTEVFPNLGCCGQRSVCMVNQDIYWRAVDGQLRSFRQAVADYSGPGNAPISREVSRVFDYESTQMLSGHSAIYHKNRLLSLAHPFIGPYGGTCFKSIVPLDCAPLALMQGKASPGFDGEWDGLYFSQLVKGVFEGRERAFAISTDADGENRLWEIDDTLTADEADSSSTFPVGIDLRKFLFGGEDTLKMLARADVWLNGITGTGEVTLYWRSDSEEQWHAWDTFTYGADLNHAAFAPGAGDLSEQYRRCVKSLTIPDEIDPFTGRHIATGYGFQIGVRLTGPAKLTRVQAWAQPLPEASLAERDILPDGSAEQTVTRIDSEYLIPLTETTPYVDDTEGEAYTDESGFIYIL